MKDIVNFALVGCGRISVNHIEALKKFQKEAKLVAVCDVEAAKARKIGEENNIDYYTNLDDMLGRGDIDAVSIYTAEKAANLSN